MRYIPLTQGLFAEVDDADFERVNQFKWHASAQGSSGERFYACRFHQTKGKRTKVWLHRFIMGLPDSLSGPDPLVVDHEDGDGLNCQRINLTVVPWSVNLAWVSGRLHRIKEADEPWL